MLDFFCPSGKKIKPLQFCNLLLELQKPPAPVALQGRLCLSAKPHEYKRSLVWLNLPPLAKLGIPRAGVATALNLQSPAVTGAPLHPTSPPPKISSLNKKKKNVNVAGEAEKLQSGFREGPVVPSCWSRFVSGICAL